MKKNFKNIKKLKIYYFFLKFIFIPFYDLVWIYLINFKDKITNIVYNFKNNNQSYISLNKNNKKIIVDNKVFLNLSEEINNNIDSNLISKKIEKLKSEKYKKDLQKIENESHKKNPFLIDIFPDLNLSLKTKIVNFATSDFMLKTANNYLGVFPILARINLNLNIPTGKQQSSSQLWHRDDFGYKNLDLFMAINSIDENNGPLFTLKKKDPLNIFFRVKNEINSGLKGERGKILDKDFDYLDSSNSENLTILKGKPGTTMLIDSIRNYHKGGYCKLNYRLVLRINYMTNDSTYPIHNLEIDRNEWLSLIKNKNFFTRYALRNRSLVFEKFEIPRKLFSFYHAVSIKN